MSVKVTEELKTPTLIVRIEGSSEEEVRKARDRYLENYSPNGYGTTFTGLHERYTDGLTRTYEYLGYRYKTAD